MRSHRLKAYLVALTLGASLHANIVQISDENQYNSEILGSNKRVLVKFSADWCSVCNGIQKPFEEIADEDEFSGITFAHIDVDRLDGVSKQNGIVGVPTFVYIENGTKKVEEIGVQNMPAFKNHLRENLRKTFQVAANESTEKLVDPAHIEDTKQTIKKVMAQTAPATEEPNIFMRVLNPITNFIMMIVSKIIGFFTTIIDAIKGFFNG